MYNNSYPNRGFHRRRTGQNSRKNFNYRGNPTRSSIHASKYVYNPEPEQLQKTVTIKHNFEDFPIHPQLKLNISLHGYRTPTPIQDQAIPLILAGRDVVGIANTGTGKTAAFLIPLIHKIILDTTQKILIIVPTRELAVQIHDQLRAFSRSIPIKACLIMGGASIKVQISQLQQNPHVVIGTPGRLKDLIDRRLLNLHGFKNIVLDEVDRMVDIGFIHDIRYIISGLPQERQSLFFSATVPSQVQSIIQSFLKTPITVSVKMKEVAQGIHQDVIRVNSKDEKIEKLQSLLRMDEYKKVLIFGRTKWGVERLSKTLLQKGFSVGSIHGNKSQNQRLRTLTQFRQNQLRVLVATDVVARGLDIDDVSHVINFDEPSTYTDYVHRIGRTGRAEKSGKAITFVG